MVDCVAVCIAGRTAKLNVCKNEKSGSVKRLCCKHAFHWPIEYWCSFQRKLEKAGIKPSSQLTSKINACMMLSMKAMYRSSAVNTDEECVTEDCCQRPVGNTADCRSFLHDRQPSLSQKCRTSGCHNVSVTQFGFCQSCSVVARQSRYSANARSTVNEPGKQSKTCANRDCVEYLSDADELCSRCYLLRSTDDSNLLASDTDTRRQLENVHNGEHQIVDDSTEPVTSAGHRSHLVKPRRSLYSTTLSPTSGNTDTAGQSSQSVMLCIGPLCVNKGLERYRGLCAACHNVLIDVNSKQHKKSTSYGSCG